MIHLSIVTVKSWWSDLVVIALHGKMVARKLCAIPKYCCGVSLAISKMCFAWLQLDVLHPTIKLCVERICSWCSTETVQNNQLDYCWNANIGGLPKGLTITTTLRWICLTAIGLMRSFHVMKGLSQDENIVASWTLNPGSFRFEHSNC
jgi:hypothetical protein